MLGIRSVIEYTLIIVVSVEVVLRWSTVRYLTRLDGLPSTATGNGLFKYQTLAAKNVSGTVNIMTVRGGHASRRLASIPKGSIC